MKIKKILLIALIINIAISFIPIPHKTLVGNEGCGALLCYEYMPSYGFPIPFLESNGLNSPIGAINTEILYAPYGIGYVIILIIFLINVFILTGAIKALELIYKKIRKLASPNKG